MLRNSTRFIKQHATKNSVKHIPCVKLCVTRDFKTNFVQVQVPNYEQRKTIGTMWRFYKRAFADLFATIKQYRISKEKILVQAADRDDVKIVKHVQEELYKMAPFVFMLAVIPGATLVVPMIAYFLPLKLPYSLQTPTTKNQFLKLQKEVRNSSAEEIIDRIEHLANKYYQAQFVSVRLLAKTSTEVKMEQSTLLLDFLTKLREDKQRIRNLADHGDLQQAVKEYIRLNIRVLKELQAIDLTGGIFQKDLLLDLLKYKDTERVWRFALGEIVEFPFRNLFRSRLSEVKNHTELIRLDDRLLSTTAQDLLTTVPSSTAAQRDSKLEILEALHTRAFDVRYDGNAIDADLPDLQEWLREWVSFSKTIKSESLMVIAPALTFGCLEEVGPSHSLFRTIRHNVFKQ